MLNRSRQKGFSLIELIIVTAIIGLLASILIPNLLDALQKARQKRTLADVKGVGTAWMQWMTDHSSAASAGATKIFSTSSFTSLGYATLVSYLRPTDTFFYAQGVPQVDGWGSQYRYAVGPNDIRLLLCAAGRDDNYAQCSQANVIVEPFLATDYDQDIIWADGYFVRWPSGYGDAAAP